MSLSETSIDHMHKRLYLVKHGQSEKPEKGIDFSLGKSGVKCAKNSIIAKFLTRIILTE